MANPVIMPAPTISVTNPDSNTHSTPDQPAPETRKTMHKNLITKLRPLPFQYVWTVYYDKPAPPSRTSSTITTAANPSTYTNRLTLLSSSVPTIADFYKIFNNIPWSTVPTRDSIHIFRSGVKPLWEDAENLEGGCWTLKVRKQHNNDSDKAKRVWEEICLMGCGGELQAALVEAGSRDAILGMSFAPRGLWVGVSVWLKSGDGWKTVERTILDRLTAELRPENERDYYWKKHSEHEGWEEAVGRKKEDAK
jgi:Eukaryotic initiation factor 4E